MSNQAMATRMKSAASCLPVDLIVNGQQLKGRKSPRNEPKSPSSCSGRADRAECAKKVLLLIPSASPSHRWLLTTGHSYYKCRHGHRYIRNRHYPILANPVVI